MPETRHQNIVCDSFDFIKDRSLVLCICCWMNLIMTRILNMYRFEKRVTNTHRGEKPSDLGCYNNYWYYIHLPKEKCIMRLMLYAKTLKPLSSLLVIGVFRYPWRDKLFNLDGTKGTQGYVVLTPDLEHQTKWDASPFFFLHKFIGIFVLLCSMCLILMFHLCVVDSG